MNAQKLQMLDAMGITVYRRTRRVRAESSVVNQNAAQEKLPAVKAAITPSSVFEEAAIAPQALAPVPAKAIKPVITQRSVSTRTEFVIAISELARFQQSKMYRHLSLCLHPGADVPVVENAVQSDTALHFEMPPAKPLKIGSVALLKSAWRARRQAWQAIRIWRKENPPAR